MLTPVGIMVVFAVVIVAQALVIGAVGWWLHRAVQNVAGRLL